MQRPVHGARLFLRILFLTLATSVAIPAAPAAGLDFTLQSAPPILSTRQFNTIAGPADGGRLFVATRLIPSGVSNSFLGIQGSILTRYTVPSTIMDEPTGALDLNDWPMGIAYDSTATRAVLVTLGGEGFLYQRPANADHWSVLASMQNEDLESLVYFPPQNAFYGLRVYYGAPTADAHFLKYSANGVKIDDIILPAFPVNIMPGDHHSELVAVDSKIVLLVERNSQSSLQTTDKSRIYVIDPAARAIELTCESVPPVAPQIYFASPSNNSSNTLGETVQIRLITLDPNKDVRTVVLRDGNATLRQWTIDPGPSETNVLEFAWAPAETGIHQLSATATDTHALIGVAQPVRVTILPPVIPPVLTMTSPLENAQYRIGTNILFTARTTTGALSTVNFYVDSTKLGDVRPTTNVTPQTFNYIWSNAIVGEHTLKAIGFNSSGQRATSAPVHIKVVSDITPAITVTRDLPDFYISGQTISVNLAVKPNSFVNAWAVEETPPADWTISEISFNGSFDSVNKKIKWGPITEHTNITLTYKALPPTNATGSKTFTGIASFDGRSVAIIGDLSIVRGNLYHPADISPKDGRLTVNEVTAYAAAWKSGANWNYEPIQIPIDYVTRAGYLWRSGETYTFNPAFQPPACWVPTNNLLKALAFDPEATNALRVVSPPTGPSRAVSVTLRVRPDAGVTTYALEELLPPSWRLSNGGGGSVSGGILRFGPYFDSQPRDIAYTVVPTTNSIIGQFQGEASFDGSIEMIQGNILVFLAAPSIQRGADGKLHLKINAAPGEQFTLESSESVEGPWQTVTQITGANTPIELPAFDPPTSRLFYRLTPAP